MTPAPPALEPSPRWTAPVLLSILALYFVAHLFVLSDHPISAHTWRASDTGGMARNFIVDHFDFLHPRIDWDRNQSGRVQTELPLYTAAVALLWGLTGEHMRYAALLSMCFGMASFLCFYYFARHAVSPRIALVATALLALSPLAFYFTSTVQPEGLLQLLAYGSLAAWVGYLRRPTTTRLALWALSLSLAAAIKPPVLLLGVPMILVARSEPAPRGGKWLRPALALALAMVIPASWFIHGHHIYLQTGNSFGVTTSGGADKFSIGLHLTGTTWYRHVARQIVALIVVIPALPFFAIGSMRAWGEKRLRFLVYWTATILLSFALLAEAVYTMEYYMLPLAGPAALLTALGLERAWSRLPVSMRPPGRIAALWLLAVVATLAGLAGTAGAWSGLARWATAEGRPLQLLLARRGVQPDLLPQVAVHLTRTLSIALAVWSVAFGILLWCVTRVSPRPGTTLAPAWLVGLAMAWVALWPVSLAAGIKQLYVPRYTQQYLMALKLREEFPPRTAGILGHEVYHRPHGFDPDPVTFFYANMHGWDIPNVDYRPGYLDTLIGRGARFFATSKLSLLEQNPGFVQALEAKGSVLERTPGYVIYEFPPRGGGLP